MPLFYDVTTDANIDDNTFVVEIANANDKGIVDDVIDVDINDDVSVAGGLRQYPRSPVDVNGDDINGVDASDEPL